MKRMYLFFLCGLLFSIFTIVPLFAADNTFKENGYGYKMNYPQDWSYTKKSLYEIVFTKNTGTDAGIPVVGIQNLYSTKVKGGKFKDLQAVIEAFEDQLRVTKHAKVYPAEAFKYSKNGETKEGRKFIAEYTYKNNNYKQLTIIIPRKNEDLYHVWVYSTKLEQYDKYLPVANAMLSSWVITD